MSHGMLSQNGTNLSVVADPGFKGWIGVGRSDITPPIGIYSRLWGSAKHDVAEGIHRHLYATALTFQVTPNKASRVLIGVDLPGLCTIEDEWIVRGPVLEHFSLDPSQVMINAAHTHSGPRTSIEDHKKPGGELIKPYLRSVSDAVIDAINKATQSAKPAVCVWRYGRCDLARNRHVRDPRTGELLTGYNPHASADDTLLVGRASASQSGRIIASIVNYACHPTTLGGGNRLISPDYVGAMREVVEHVTDGAPCLFLQGASGELAPRRQYLADTGEADRNGRQLGYAVLSTLEGMLPHDRAMKFSGVEESGTRLGRWEDVSHTPSTVDVCDHFHIELPVKQLPTKQTLEQQIDQSTSRVMIERLERARLFRCVLEEDRKSLTLPVWLWRLGDAVLLGTPCEAYSHLQSELRRRFAPHPVVVMNIVNGHRTYLVPSHNYTHRPYEAEISLFAAGAFETVLENCVDRMTRIINLSEQSDQPMPQATASPT